MPHKPSQPRDPVSFVSVSLTVALKHALADWAAECAPDLIKWMSHAVEGGYRISVKEEAEGYSANMATTRPEGSNKGLVLMERGGTPERALLRLMWAHNVYFKLIWPRDRQAGDDDW
jgi:hypothetical protein